MLHISKNVGQIIYISSALARLFTVPLPWPDYLHALCLGQIIHRPSALAKLSRGPLPSPDYQQALFHGQIIYRVPEKQVSKHNNVKLTKTTRCID